MAQPDLQSIPYISETLAGVFLEEMLNYFPGEEKLIPISKELKLRTNLDRIFGVACYQIRLFLTTVNLLVIPIHSMIQSAWGIKAIRLGDGINTSADHDVSSTEFNWIEIDIID